MNNNPIKLKCIDELLQEEFFVPDFQRGYRWSAEQVRALLDDIWKFRTVSENATSSAFYCLQPLVVAKAASSWILIDGQQRLTTIRLILLHLKLYMDDNEKRFFKLCYQTRPDSESFLDNPSEDKASECPDYYHMFEAFNTIKQWFSEKGGASKTSFFSTLLGNNEQGKNVKIIWYEVPGDDVAEQVNIFTRLNIGKIPLTNAELIKAFLLQKGNFSKEQATLRQIQIASEWDLIEQKLQQPDFWHFIYKNNRLGTYENRIEYIFDLMFSRTIEHERHYTFHEFYKNANISRTATDRVNIDGLWLSVKEYFQVFEEWFSDRDTYHMIGFLVHCGVEIAKLRSDFRNMNKIEFKALLKIHIKATIDFDVRELDYSEAKDKEKIRRALLLFNIHTLMISKEADVRFPFHRYKMLGWDIEHIRSQTNKEIRGKQQQQDWLTDVFSYFTGKKLPDWVDKNVDELSDKLQQSDTIKDFCQRIIELYKQNEIDLSSFDNLKHDLQKYFKEDAAEDSEESEITHSIGNLALLNETINRSYKNAMFPIKRKKIIEYDEKGEFLPICTKNAFLKYYSNRFDEAMYWSKDDAQAYEEAIFETIENYRNN